METQELIEQEPTPSSLRKDLIALSDSFLNENGKIDLPDNVNPQLQSASRRMAQVIDKNGKDFENYSKTAKIDDHDDIFDYTIREDFAPDHYFLNVRKTYKDSDVVVGSSSFHLSNNLSEMTREFAIGTVVPLLNSDENSGSVKFMSRIDDEGEQITQYLPTAKFHEANDIPITKRISYEEAQALELQEVERRREQMLENGMILQFDNEEISEEDKELIDELKNEIEAGDTLIDPTELEKYNELHRLDPKNKNNKEKWWLLGRARFTKIYEDVPLPWREDKSE